MHLARKCNSFIERKEVFKWRREFVGDPKSFFLSFFSPSRVENGLVFTFLLLLMWEVVSWSSSKNRTNAFGEKGFLPST